MKRVVVGEGPSSFYGRRKPKERQEQLAEWEEVKADCPEAVGLIARLSNLAVTDRCKRGRSRAPGSLVTAAPSLVTRKNVLTTAKRFGGEDRSIGSDSLPGPPGIFLGLHFPIGEVIIVEDRPDVAWRLIGERIEFE